MGDSRKARNENYDDPVGRAFAKQARERGPCAVGFHWDMEKAKCVPDKGLESLLGAGKDSNPKDAAGSARIDPTLISPFAVAECALAMEEGATKYGRYNYTVVGVKSRVYVAAAMRHLWKYLLGEDRDPKTGVHHLGSVMACAAILIDAEVRGKLTDDRPPSHKEASTWLDRMEARVKKVREVFKDYAPIHYTIEDTQNGTGKPLHTQDTQTP